MIVMENADGTPLTRQDQLGQTVAIQVTPDSAANQAHLLQSAGVLLVKQPASAVTTVNLRRGGLGITACNYPATHEHPQSADALDISQGQWSRTRIHIGDNLFNCFAGEVILPNPARHSLALFIIGAASQDQSRLSFLAANEDTAL